MKHEEAHPRRNWTRALLPVAVAIIALVYPKVFRLPYPQHVGVLVCMNALMAVAWNITGGYTGQVALGNTVFFGIGAYTSSLLLRDFGVNPWIGMLAGMALSMIAAVVLGYTTFRLRGYYFTIACIALAEIVSAIVVNTRRLGGAVGVTVPIREASLINFQFHGTNKAPYYYTILTFLAIALLVVYKMERSKLGYYFRAIREDEDGARALGVNAAQYKLIAFMRSALFTSMAGTFYAQYVMFIDPMSVLAQPVSVSMCLMAVLGGLGTLWGPVLGALTLIGISEATRVTLGGTGQAVDLMLYGLLVMLFAVFQPKGLMGMFGRLKARKE